jgi:redox-regulated HSP33 family molecular chaperone
MNKKERVTEEVGKIFVNLGHLVFASLVFGSILKGEGKLLMPLVSTGAAVLLFVLGVIFLTKGGKK